MSYFIFKDIILINHRGKFFRDLVAYILEIIIIKELLECFLRVSLKLIDFRSK